MFFEYKSIGDFLYTILNGAGHLWFLPMLFWCFLIGLLVQKIKIRSWMKYIWLVLIALISYLPLPLRLGSTMYYFLFFYGGIIIYQMKETILVKLNNRILIVLWICFISAFVGLTIVQNQIAQIEFDGIIMKAILLSLDKVCRIFYSTLGLFALYCTSLFFIECHQIPNWLAKISKYCFGVYLFQQFILQLLYYNTSIPVDLGPYVLPWFGFVVTIILSLFLSWITSKTRVGRFLIG